MDSTSTAVGIKNKKHSTKLFAKQRSIETSMVFPKSSLPIAINLKSTPDLNKLNPPSVPNILGTSTLHAEDFSKDSIVYKKNLEVVVYPVTTGRDLLGKSVHIHRK